MRSGTGVDTSAAPEAAARPAARAKPARPRVFFVLAVVLLLTVILGFAPTFYLDPLFETPEDAAPMPLYLVIHALFLTTWFVGLVAQTALIQRGRYDTHRTVGWFLVACFVGVVVTGAGATLALLARDTSPRMPTLTTSNTFSLLIFVTLVPLAVYHRARPAIHMRLMVIASIVIVGPALGPGRMLGQFLGSLLPDFVTVPVPLFFWIPLVGAIVVHDVVTKGKVHPATLWGGGAKALATVISLWAVSSGVSAAYVEWLRGLVTG